MSTAKRVVKNTIYLYGKIAITSVCLILSTRYTLQALGVEDFGIYNLICSTVVMLSFLNESMTAATQRFMSYAEGEGRLDKSIKIFNSSYVVHIGISLLVATIFLLIMPIVFGDYLTIPQERILLNSGSYFVAVRFVDCDESVRWQKEENIIKPSVCFPLFLKDSYKRENIYEKPEQVSFNIGMSIIGSGD